MKKSDFEKAVKSLIREVNVQSLKHKPELSKRTKYSFNLAACFLPVLYNLVYRRPCLAACFLILTAFPHMISRFASDTTYMFFVQFVTYATVILAVFSGITGNSHVYKVRDYDDEIDFLKSQRFWIPVAILAIAVHWMIWPAQQVGHYNTNQMIKLAQEKSILAGAIQKGASQGNLLGVNTVGNDVPQYFAQYLGEGSFDGQNTIIMPNGAVYYIEGYMYECGSTYSNTFFGQKTACATVTIDLNGGDGPNNRTEFDAKNISKILNTTKLGDRFVIYAYDNDLAPMDFSIEQAALKRFER